MLKKNLNLNYLASVRGQFTGLQGRHPGQWPLIPQAFCAAGVFAAVLVAGWFLYGSSQVDELDAGVQEEEKLKDAYKQKIQQAINLEELKRQKEQVSQYVASLEKQLPSKAEMDALLSDINQAGLGRGLQFELFKPGQVVAKEYYAELPISIKIKGNYHDVASFASDIAALPRIVTLNNMNLASPGPGGGKLMLETTAKTFRYLDKEEIEAQRKMATDKNKKGEKK